MPRLLETKEHVRIPNGKQYIDFKQSVLIQLQDLERNGGTAYALSKLKSKNDFETLKIVRHLVKDENGNIVLAKTKDVIDFLSFVMEDSDSEQGSEEFMKWVHATLKITATKGGKSRFRRDGKRKANLKIEILEYPVNWQD